jgi:hypothetical protein
MPDGFQPRAQFYLFTDPPFRFRDSAFDPDVVVHELVHGLTSRMIGNAVDFFCFEGVQSGAMSEGWSDFLALSFLDDNVMGEWVTGNPERGIRRYPYSSDLEENPLTYGDLCNQGCQVHRDGEIWGTVLWDLREAMIERFGKEIGVPLTEQLVVEALSFTPCSPNFLDGRDALLAADQVMNGGGNRCLIWSVFARRGMGDLAESVSNGSDVTPGFDPPCGCFPYEEPRFLISSVALDDGAQGNANGVLEPAEVVGLGITLQNNGAPASDISIRAISRDPDLTIVEDLAFWPDLACSGSGLPVAGRISVIAGSNVIRDQKLSLDLVIEYGPEAKTQVLPLDLVVCPGSYEFLTDIPFDWQQASPGIAYTGWDDMTFEADLGFDFPFYGEFFNKIYVSTNGVIAFGNNPGLTNIPQELPDPVAPNHVIAPFWTDLNFESAGSLVMRLSGSGDRRRYIVEWRDVPHYPNLGRATFQVVLYEQSGEILFQYKDVFFGSSLHDYGASASIGIEDRYGINGLNYSFEEPVLEDGTAILIRPRPCAAIVSPRAYLKWVDRGIPCGGMSTLELRDLDQAGSGSIILPLSYLPAESQGRRPLGTILMEETAPPSGIFSGVFSIDSGADIMPGHGDLIYAQYVDESSAGGPRQLEAMLAVDCEPPDLLSTGVNYLEPEEASIYVRASENSTGSLLLYKDACPAGEGEEPWLRVDGVFITSYSGLVYLDDLLPGTQYFYKWILRDTSGNEIIIDNDGICYEFSTPPRTVAEYPFLEDFELEELASYWEAASRDEGRITITSTLEPYHGRKHLIMDDYLINSARSLNELTLTIDLEGQEDVSLRFFHKSFGDEVNSLPEQFDDHYKGDGVAMSLDGKRWYRLISLIPAEGVQSEYREFRIPLDPILKKTFGTFNDRVKIRFQQYDNSPADQDGFAFDYIQVVPVDHEAPDFDGLISAQPGQNSVRLGWYPATDDSQPIVYRGYMAQEPGQQNFQEPVFETGGTIHEVKGLNAARDYYFVVRSVDGNGNEDGNRTELAVRPLDTIAPVFLGVRSLLEEADGVRLGWVEALDPSQPITYEVFMGSPGAPESEYDRVLETTNVFAEVTGLVPGEEACFLVRARDAIGNVDDNSEILCGSPIELLPKLPPIIENFEEGRLSDSWRKLGTGRVTVTDEFGGYSSNFALLLDSGEDLPEVQGVAAVLLADLERATNVVVQFSYRNLGDEPNLLPDRFEDFAIGDGVAVSPDGIQWIRVFSLAGGSDGLWRNATISLDPIMRNAGWDYTDRFRIGFFQADNSPAPRDGLMFDAIQVREKDTEPPAFEGLETISARDSSAVLRWSPAVETESPPVWYEVYRGTEEGMVNYQSPVAFSDQTTAVVSNLSGVTKYWFAVRARDAAGNVDTNKVEKMVSPYDFTPPEFSGLSDIQPGDRSLQLFWPAARDASRPITYQVYQVTNHEIGPVLATTQQRTAAVTGLRNGKEYCFIVRARDAAGMLDQNTSTVCGIPRVAPGDIVFIDGNAAPETADGSAAHPYTTLADGLAASAPGVEIRLAAGEYHESLVINDPVSISGGWSTDFSVFDPDFFPSVIAGEEGSERVLDVMATGVHLSGLRFQPAVGLGIRIVGSVTMSRCAMAGLEKTAEDQGAVFLDGGQLIMQSCRVRGFGRQEGPVFYVDNGYLEMESVLLTGFSLSGPQPAIMELDGGSTAHLRLVTATGNILNGGVVVRAGSEARVEGVGLILKRNLGASIDVFPDATAEISYSFLDPYWGTPDLGAGVDMNAEPGFRNPALGDYHLSSHSVAVDYLSEDVLALPVHPGADGLWRPFGEGLDAGAFEYRDSDGDGAADDVDSDADGDGLPNSWERRFGLNWLEPDSETDSDLDGFGNLAEYRAGTDPLDSASALLIQRMQISFDEGRLALRWHAVPGHGYIVERVVSWGQEWVAVSPPLYAEHGDESLEFTAELDQLDTALFRVRLLE